MLSVSHQKLLFIHYESMDLGILKNIPTDIDELFPLIRYSRSTRFNFPFTWLNILTFLLLSPSTPLLLNF